MSLNDIYEAELIKKEYNEEKNNFMKDLINFDKNKYKTKNIDNFTKKKENVIEVNRINNSTEINNL